MLLWNTYVQSISDTHSQSLATANLTLAKHQHHKLHYAGYERIGIYPTMTGEVSVNLHLTNFSVG